MRSPDTEMRTYLKRLVNCYMNLDCMDRQLSEMARWKVGDKRKAFERGEAFFNWAAYSLSRTILVELAAMLSPSADRSLIDWLGKAKEHAESLKPTRYNQNSPNERETLSKDAYRAVIDAQLLQLNSHAITSDNILSHRNKAIAHFDKPYFENPEQIHEDYPLSKKDVRLLLNEVRDILKDHYGYLFESDLNMQVQSLYTLDAVLEYTLGFIRMQEDPDLLEKGFEPMKYLPELEPRIFPRGA